MSGNFESLRNGLGESFLEFLRDPRDVLLSQVLVASAYCEEGIEERSIFLAKLFFESGVELPTSALDFFSVNEELWEIFARRNLPILQAFLFFDLLHSFYEEKNEKGRVEFQKYLDSRKKNWFLLSLEVLSRLSNWEEDLPVWLCREVNQALDHWDLNCQEWRKVLRTRSPSLVSDLASQILVEVFQEVQPKPVCKACSTWEFSESQKIRLRKAVSQKEPPGHLKGMLPECIVSFLPDARNIQKENYISYCQKLRDILPHLTGCGGHVHLKIIGFLLGLLGDPSLFNCWIEIPKKWPALQFPKGVMAGFLEGLSSIELKRLLNQLSFSSGWCGYILALHRIRLIESGLFPKEDLIDLFEKGLEEKNEKIINCAVNAIERGRFSLPENLCLKGYYLAPYLRNRAFCFSKVCHNFTTEELISSLFDASFFVQEMAFEQIQKRGEIEQISRVLKKKMGDPFLPLSFKGKLVGYFS